MKKNVPITLAGKKTKLEFSILDLSNFEALIGRSIISLFTDGDILKNNTLNLTIAGLACGLPEKPSMAEAADLIQQHCDKGGNIFELGQAVGEAISASGIFGGGSSSAKKKEPTAEN